MALSHLSTKDKNSQAKIDLQAIQKIKGPRNKRRGFEKLLDLYPDNKALILPYISFLLQQEENEDAQEVMRDLLIWGQWRLDLTQNKDPLLLRLAAKIYHSKSLLQNRALQHIDAAFLLGDGTQEAHHIRAGAQIQLFQYDAALKTLNDCIVAYSPDCTTYRLIESCLHGKKEYEQALSITFEALKGFPEDEFMRLRRLANLDKLRMWTEHLYYINEYIDKFTDDPEALERLANILWDTDNIWPSIQVNEIALKANPRKYHLFQRTIGLMDVLCMWEERDRIIESYTFTEEDIAANGYDTFRWMFIIDNAEKLRKYAELYWRSKNRRTYISLQSDISPSIRPAREKIRLCYCSPDFNYHVVMHCISSLFNLHDQNQFEVFCIAYGDRPVPEALLESFQNVTLIDVTEQPDIKLREQLDQVSPDILIDLAGWTKGSRAHFIPPARAGLRINWLGFPGTLGTEKYHYIIADSVVIPPHHSAFYTENVVRLPHSYLMSDRKRPLPHNKFTRAQFGLPENGIVLVSMNQPRKMDKVIYETWMRILKEVEGSVLWLGVNHDMTLENLLKRAQDCGVNPERIIPARKVGDYVDHLSRLCLADIALDTWPYNSHVTGVDMLWSGLPMVTYLGGALHARVAASLLHAVGLPELVTTSWEAYQSTVVDLCRDPHRRGVLRQHLINARDTAPLYDAQQFTHHLEEAYKMMFEKWQKGEAPSDIAVEISS